MFVVWTSNHHSIHKLTAQINSIPLQQWFGHMRFGKACVFPRKIRRNMEMKGVCVEKAQNGGNRQWERGGGPAESHSSGQPAWSSEENRTLPDEQPCKQLWPVTWLRPLASNSHLNQLQSWEMAFIGADMHLNNSFMTKTQNQDLLSVALPATTRHGSSAAPSLRHH